MTAVKKIIVKNCFVCPYSEYDEPHKRFYCEKLAENDIPNCWITDNILNEGKIKQNCPLENN